MGAEQGLLIQPDWLVTDARTPPRPGWGVRVVADLIDAVGPNSDLAGAHPSDDVVAAPGRILMPGFVNSHVHMYGVLAHGIPTESAPAGFWPFLEDFWWPQVEDRLDQEMIRAAADWVCTEMLLSGTTTFLDILEAPATLPDALLMEKEIVDEHGLRGILSFEATERSGPEIGQRGLQENLSMIDACGDGDLTSGMMCTHTTFTCSDDFIRQAYELAAANDVLLHAHCNEGVHEGSWCLEHNGRRTVEHYDHLGVAGPRFLASQCVHLSPDEFNLVVDRGIRCTHMPLANCEVGGGIAPVPELLEAGVTVGLGSDGYVNDIYEVMRGAFLIHKARLQDPGVMPAPEVLAMATETGARALGLDMVGRLEPGWSADLQLIDAAFPTPVNEGNLIGQIILSRSGHHVDSVMVAGSWRVRNKEVIGSDPERQSARLHEQATRLWGS